MSELVTLARTIYGEARGDGAVGMEAVALVIMNRKEVSDSIPNFWWGYTVEEICKKPYQFSCWNEKDPNRKKIESVTDKDPAFKEALEIAEDALAGLLIFDMTNGATHYLNPYAVDILPVWAKGRRLAVIGKHHFFRPKEVPPIKRRQLHVQKDKGMVQSTFLRGLELVCSWLRSIDFRHFGKD